MAIRRLPGRAAKTSAESYEQVPSGHHRGPGFFPILGPLLLLSSLLAPSLAKLPRHRARHPMPHDLSATIPSL